MTAVSTLSWSRIVHYGVLLALLIGGGLYLAFRPSFTNPMADPQAAEAMALVQTHPALGAPTIRQAITDMVRGLESRGHGVRLGEWRVEQERDGVYLVHIMLREQGAKEWFERNFLWRVDLGRRSVLPLTMPATGVMPVDTDAHPPA